MSRLGKKEEKLLAFLETTYEYSAKTLLVDTANWEKKIVNTSIRLKKLEPVENLQLRQVAIYFKSIESEWKCVQSSEAVNYDITESSNISKQLWCRECVHKSRKKNLKLM